VCRPYIKDSSKPQEVLGKFTSTMLEGQPMEIEKKTADGQDTAPKPQTGATLRQKVEQSIIAFETGRSIAELKRIWGWVPLLTAVLGFLVAAAMVQFGGFPNWVIADKYKSLIEEQKPTSKPNSLDITEVQRLQEWTQVYTYYLEREAQDLMAKGEIKDYMICVVETKELSPFLAFDWVLSTSADYEVHGYGFKLGQKETFQRLLVSKDEPRSLRFTVGESSRKGEKLLAIVRVSWKQSLASVACTDVLRSAVRQ
jgi:hypothetical protein